MADEKKSQATNNSGAQDAAQQDGAANKSGTQSEKTGQQGQQVDEEARTHKGTSEAVKGRV